MKEPPRPEPIACSLDAQGARVRLEEFRQVFRRGFLGGERIDGGVRWRFRNDPGLETELRALADREQACCPFFRFHLHATATEICWDLRSEDPEAQPVIEEFFRLPSLRP